MSISVFGWKNKAGTASRACKCGSWKNHWLNYNSGNVAWPASCAVEGCYNTPTLGAHIINSSVTGERIAPLCDSCNKLASEFSLKNNTYVPSANRSETCG